MIFEIRVEVKEEDSRAASTWRIQEGFSDEVTYKPDLKGVQTRILVGERR